MNISGINSPATIRVGCTCKFVILVRTVFDRQFCRQDSEKVDWKSDSTNIWCVSQHVLYFANLD